MCLLLSISVGELKIADMIFTLFFYLILIGLVIGIISLIIRNKRLKRIENKIDILVEKKEK